LFQLVKAISLGCLGYAAEAVEAANVILATLHSSATVRTWHYAAPQLRNIIPVDVIVAFNRLIAPLVMQKTRKPAAPPEEPVDPLTAAVVAAHPWKFWGECPGGILPWRPVVLSPTQFHRSPRARKQIDAVLSPAAETASEYVTALRALEDPEHVNFSPSKRCTLKLNVQSDLLREGDADMHELFAGFEAMNFSPVKATRRR
jgi:hypothetical protein